MMRQNRHYLRMLSSIGVIILTAVMCNAQIPQYGDPGPYNGPPAVYGNPVYHQPPPMYGPPNPGYNGYNNMGPGGYNPCPGACSGGYNPPMAPGGYNPMVGPPVGYPQMGGHPPHGYPPQGYPPMGGGYNPMMGPGPGVLNNQQRRSDTPTENSQITPNQITPNTITPNDLITTSTASTTPDLSFMDSYDKFDIGKREAYGPAYGSYGPAPYIGGPPINTRFIQPSNFYNQPNYGNGQPQLGYGPPISFNRPPQPCFGCNGNNWPPGQFGYKGGQQNQEDDTTTTTAAATTTTTATTSTPTSTLNNSDLAFTEDDSIPEVRGRWERYANRTKTTLPFPSEILGVGPVMPDGNNETTVEVKTGIKPATTKKVVQKSVVVLVHPIRMERSKVSSKGVSDVTEEKKNGGDDRTSAATYRPLYNQRSSFNRPKRDDATQTSTGSTSTATTTTKEEFGSFQMVNIL